MENGGANDSEVAGNQPTENMNNKDPDTSIIEDATKDPDTNQNVDSLKKLDTGNSGDLGKKPDDIEEAIKALELDQLNHSTFANSIDAMVAIIEEAVKDVDDKEDGNDNEFSIDKFLAAQLEFGRSAQDDKLQETIRELEEEYTKIQATITELRTDDMAQLEENMKELDEEAAELEVEIADVEKITTEKNSEIEADSAVLDMIMREQVEENAKIMEAIEIMEKEAEKKKNQEDIEWLINDIDKKL